MNIIVIVLWTLAWGVNAVLLRDNSERLDGMKIRLDRVEAEVWRMERERIDETKESC